MSNRKRVRRCPKCGGSIQWYTEVWTGHVIDFDAGEDGEPEPTGFLNEGSPDHVQATCGKCHHKWKLRGVTQITELRSKA